MRDIVEVIEQIKPLMDDVEISNQLDSISDEALYTAPEAMYVRWNDLGFQINRYCPIPLQTENQVKIVSIFTTIPEEMIKERYSYIGGV